MEQRTEGIKLLRGAIVEVFAAVQTWATVFVGHHRSARISGAAHGSHGASQLHIDADERTNVTSAWHISFACMIWPLTSDH